MKNIVYIILAISLMSCAKNNSIQPTTPAPVSSGMTSMETSLIGKWMWDSTVVYNTGVRVCCYPNTDSAGPYSMYRDSYMDLKSTWYYNMRSTSGPQQYDNTTFVGPAPNTLLNGFWHVLPPMPTKSRLEDVIGGMNWAYIESVTSTRLVLVEWPSTLKQGMTSYFHK